jgi:hypothetical protein
MPSITCSNCQTESAEGTAFCPGCGTALAVVTSAETAPTAILPTTPAAAPTTPPAAAPTPSTPTSSNQGSQIKFDAAKLSQDHLIVGIASLFLLIFLFLPWFSANGLGTASGIKAHGYLFITFTLCVEMLVLLVVQALSIWTIPEESPFTQDQVFLTATGINFVLVLIAFLFKPAGGAIQGFSFSWGWSFGGFIALVAAIVALAPMAWPEIVARRNK